MEGKIKQNKEEQRTIHSYISHGKVQNVACTRKEYLFLKLTYGDEDLTEEEYKEYKNYINNEQS